MSVAICLNILYIGVVLFVKTEAGLLDSVPLVTNLNNVRNQGGRYQTHQWMGNHNNALHGVANALVGLTRNTDQNSGTNAHLNGQNRGLDSLLINAGNLGTRNWNSINQRPTFNNINKPNIGQPFALENGELEKKLERLKDLQKNNRTTLITNNDFNDRNLINQAPAFQNINKLNTGQITALEKEKEDLEKLLERLKELNKLKDLQKNTETTTPSSSNNIYTEIDNTVRVTTSQGSEDINDISWNKITNRKIVFQIKPVFPEGDTPPTSYNSDPLYYFE